MRIQIRHGANNGVRPSGEYWVRFTHLYDYNTQIPRSTERVFEYGKDQEYKTRAAALAAAELYFDGAVALAKELNEEFNHRFDADEAKKMWRSQKNWRR